MSSIRLRPAQSADAEAIARLVDVAYGRYIDRIGRKPRPMLDDYSRVIAERQVTVAEVDGRIAGMIVLDRTLEGFLLENVAADGSRRGIGKALLEFAEAEALKQGFNSIYLYTHELMVENQSLYSRIGYTEYDRRVENGFSRVYMRKFLAP